MTTTKQTPSRIAFKSDTRENWAKAKNFIPLKGEPIHYSDINKIKIGDGATNVRNLPFADSLPPSEGIAYELSDDETYAICTGRDGFTGTLLVIASEYKNKPVTHIGESAFADLDHRFPALINVVLPNTITHIGNYAFQGCGIQEINIPNSVIYIDDGAFIQNSLVSITIPDSVTSIGNVAFCNCTSLTSIVIPDSVTRIEPAAFYNCSSLTIYCEAKAQPEDWPADWNLDNRPVIWGCALDIPAINDRIISVENNIGDIEAALDAIITIQEGLISGGDPEPVPSAGLAFTEVDGGYMVSDIGTCADTDIVIPNKYNGLPVTGINFYAFNGNLTSIYIPDSITNISVGSIVNCPLESITVDENNTVYHSAENCLIETESKTLIVGCKNSIIPTDGSVTSIGAYAFHGNGSPTKITIPDSVTSIDSSAFSACFNLTYVTIPGSVTSIGYSAFSACSNLADVIIGNGVISIGEHAFSGCSSLTSIVIPDSVTSIGEGAFSGCPSLTSVTIGDSVTSIGGSAFSNCTSLISITIPNSVTSIGWGAFYECTSLTDIYVPWSEAEVANAPWGATNATIHYNSEV